ncbi:MAG: hypothetical protein HN420_18850, partial [Rhodospirillaceae bacterium]|nr:hypothetical protein [Rhodospirillaceae bacterium]
RSAVDSKHVDPRKLTAYQFWAIVSDEGGLLRLADRGREFSRATEAEKPAIYRQIINETRAYRIACEWIYHAKLDEVTNVEVAAHWHEHCSDELGTESEKTMRYQVASFFHLAQSAGFGTQILGRRGASTRLTIDTDGLASFITGEVAESAAAAGLDGDVGGTENGTGEQEEPDRTREDGDLPPAAPEPAKPKVFISHSANMDIVDQLKTMLDLAETDYEVAVEEESAAIPVPDKVMEAMRRCTAAVICVTADEANKRDDDSYDVNPNVLIEIGSAFVLYERRVVLVWDRRVVVPSNLQGLYRCQFEGDELAWSSGMKLMAAVAKFKRGETAE